LVFLSENSFNNSPIHKSAPNKNPFLASFKKGHFFGLVDEGKSLWRKLAFRAELGEDTKPPKTKPASK